MSTAGAMNSRVDFLAGIQIEAFEPAELVAWYESLLGIKFSTEHEGGFYGAFPSGSVTLSLAIVPTKSPFQFSKNMTLTFHVSGLADHLKHLSSLGLKPTEELSSPQGQFAFFQDPEGNRIGLWG